MSNNVTSYSPKIYCRFPAVQTLLLNLFLINRKLQAFVLQQALLLDCSYSNLILGHNDAVFLDKCESPWLLFLMVHIYTHPQYQMISL